MEMLPRLAEENSLSVVYVNQVGCNDSLIFDGNSFCINSQGRIYAHAKSFEEDLLVVELDSDKPESIHVDDMEDIRKGLVLGIKDYMHKSGFKKFSFFL